MSQLAFQSRLAGKSVCFAGRLAHRYDHAAFVKALQADGVQVVDEVTDKLDYLVLGASGFNTQKKKAEQLNQKNGCITIIDEQQFYAQLAPTLDEVLEMIRAGRPGVNRLSTILNNARYKPHLPSLSGQDLRGADLRGLRIDYYANILDGIDLRGADLSDTMASFHDCQLDGAKFDTAIVMQLVNCSATGTDFSKVQRIGGYGELKNTDFSRSNLQGVKIVQGLLNGCKFDDADLRGADLSRCIFPSMSTSMRDADFSAALLIEAKLHNADLCGCKFIKANLTCAEFTGANVEGADFTDAHLAGAVFTNVDVSKAIGLDPSKTPAQATVGPHVKEWVKIAKKARKLATSIKLQEQGEFDVTVTMYPRHMYAQDNRGGYWSQGAYSAAYHGSSTPEQILAMVANRWNAATPIPSSITVSASQAGKSSKELKALAVHMWCELFGVTAPSEVELKEQKKASLAGKKSQLDDWLQILRKSSRHTPCAVATESDGTRSVPATLPEESAGIDRWNKDIANIRKQFDARLHGVDLSRAALAGWDVSFFDCKDANFAETDLRKANLKRAKLVGVNLAKANCQEAQFLTASLKNANCKGADFSRADLTHADLCGADFTGAILRDARLEGVRFDADTKFPNGFTPSIHMLWQGEGQSPAHQAQVAKLKAKTPLDIDAFMKRLEAGVDTSKLAKALSMLKADRFKLYAQVTDDYLVGIVKSQGDANLVYSCKLASNGVYGCCTQNLNICGGLRGSLCKHLLVLIVGLTKAGDLDPNAVDTWILASRGQKPMIDKDVMSETFLRYKGAEAGEVDWRPTETIPEDYYAM